MAIRSVTLSDTIGELVTEFNLMATDIGDLSLLTTSNTSSIVAAIASLDSDLRADFGVALDSAGIIDLITDPSSLFSIFDSSDFEIVNGVVSIRDSDTTFTTLNTTTLNTTTINTNNIISDSSTITTINVTNLNGTNADFDSASITTLTTLNGVATNLTVENLTADSASITTLTTLNGVATNLTVENLTADSGTITTISFTNAYGGNIAAGNIDADSAYFTGVVNAQDFNSTSDESLKENIETLNNAIDIVNRIRPVSFTWKKNNQIAYGVIAQEVEDVLPAIVDEDKDHIKRVAYSQLIPFLVQVIQEQHKEIENIKSHLNLK